MFGSSFGQTSGFGSFGQNTLASKPATSTFAGTGTSLFGAPANTGGFGATAAPATNVFGQPQTSATSNIFGGSGFNQPKPATGNIFGAPQQTSTLFGQPNRMAGTGTGSLFGATGAATATVSPFTSAGQAQPQGTSIPFNPITGSDTMMRNGVASPISTRNQCITCMKEYENKSLEELRLEDYQLGRKGPSQGNVFGGAQQQQQAQQPAGGIFGGTMGQPGGAASTAFGQQPSAFGGATQQASGGLFSSLNQPKPQTSFFPSSGAQQQSAFGSTATPFSLTTSTAGQPGSLFPASSASTGGFGSSFAFPSATSQAQSSMGLFGAKTVTSQAGQTSFGGFNTSTVASKPGPLFGQPQTSTSFGTSATTPFGQTGTSLFSSTPQQNKPLFGQPFGAQLTSQPGFGTTNFSSFSTPSSQPTLNFNTGTSFGTSGIGGTTFPSFGTSTTTNFGSSITNTGLGANTFSGLGSTNLGQTSGFSLFQPNATLGGPAGNPNLNVSGGGGAPFGTTPYKDSPLFYNLIANRSLDDMTKPTNPVAQRQIREASRRKTSTSLSTTNGNAVKNLTFPAPKNHTALKDQFFDGFEEEDQGTTIDILSPKSSVKKLNLKNLHGFSRYPMSSNSSFNVSATEESKLSPEKETPSKSDSHRSDKNMSNSSVSELFIHRPTGASAAESTGLNDSGSSESPSESFYVAVNNNQKNNGKNANESSDMHEKSLDQSGHVEAEESDRYDGAQNHPCGVICTRVGYYINPDVKELDLMTDAQGNCFVRGFVVGRHNYGEIRFLDVVNVGNLNVDETVLFRHKEVVVYPDDNKKPPVGEGINVPAEIRLERVWPIDKATKDPIKVPAKIRALKYEEKLKRSCQRLGAEFVSYDENTGMWVFRVNHFSKYSCAPEEEEDDEVQSTMDVGKGGGLGGKTIQQLKSFVGPTKALIMDEDEGQQGGEFQKTGLGIQEIEEMEPDQAARGGSGEPCVMEPPMEKNGFLEPAILSPPPAGGDILDTMMDFGDEEKDEFPDYFGLTEVLKPIQPPRPSSVVTKLPAPLITAAAKVPQHRKRDEIAFMDATKKQTKFLVLHRYPKSNLKNGTRVGFGPAGNFVRVINKSRDYPRANRFIGQVKLEKITPYREVRNRGVGGFSEFYGNMVTKQLVLILENSCENNLYKLRSEGIIGELIKVFREDAELSKWINAGGCGSEPQFISAFKEELQLWNLCNILWPYEELSEAERQDKGYLIEHRVRLSNWLKSNAPMLFGDQYDKNDKSLKGLLKKGQHLEACELAVDEGNFILALNLAQCCGDSQKAMQLQLEEWGTQGMLEFIPKDLLEIYQLCTGLPIWNDVDLRQMSTSEWLQHFAIYLWYICPMEFSIEEAVIDYQRMILEHSAHRDDLSQVAEYPSRLDSSIANTCIHLLKAYVTVGYNLRNILNPRTNNPDCLDYRLSWFLMQNLKQFGLLPESELEEDLTVGFAGQLESMGLFHWAIYVLRTLPHGDDSTTAAGDIAKPGRQVLIDRILERNVTLQKEQQKCIEFLETVLEIPRDHILAHSFPNRCR